jgi:predicted lactoylglutathione lyase
VEPRISLLTLAVHDLKRSVAFYEALGWTRKGAEEGVAFFQLGPMVLSLYPRGSLARDMDVSPHGEGLAGITIAYNTRTKDEVDTVVARFTSAGGAIIRAPFTADWGGYIAYVTDVDGHVWEIAHNPFSTIQPDGSFVI